MKIWYTFNLDQIKIKIKSVNALYEGQQLTLNAFLSGIFLIKSTQGKGVKILTLKQMLQLLSIDLAQVKAVETYEKLLNEIRQTTYYLYWEKKLLQKYITTSWIQ